MLSVIVPRLERKMKVLRWPSCPQTTVTASNRSTFVSAFVSFLLDSRHRRQFSAFLTGFRLVAADIALDLFRPQELQLLVAGSNQLDFKVS